MSVRLPKRDCFTRKLAHPIMLVPKFGRINLMIANLIFGLWDALFTKCVLWFHHLELMI